jgi:tRNA(fMet)-specific endonuclease VapC
MTLYVLDTNIISGLMRGESDLEERLLREPPSSIYLAQPVLSEIAFGLEYLPRSRKKTELTRRFELLAAVLPRAVWSDDVSRKFGSAKAELERKGQRIDDFDVAIAAHALALAATLVTRNVRHFSRVQGLSVEVW